MAYKGLTDVVSGIFTKIRGLPCPALESLEFRQKLNTELGFGSRDSENSSEEKLPSSALLTFANSGLPADSLNYVLELRNSASGLVASKKIAALSTSKQLLDTWIRSGLCAETLVRYCITPTSSTETSHFSRNLFAVPEIFQLQREEFLKHILVQCLIAVAILAEYIKTDEQQNVIRTSFISSIIDRTFLRYHTDQEHLLPYFDSENEFLPDESTNPFLDFIVLAAEVCSSCFISRRLMGKVFLNVSQVSTVKIAKTVFLVDSFFGSHATILLHPNEEFFSNRSWKQSLSISIPMKSRLQNLNYYTSWAKLITEQHNDVITEVMDSLIDNWNMLMRSSIMDTSTIISFSYALAALAKALRKKTNADSNFDVLKKTSTILAGVTDCLNSTNSEKQACGMAVGQIFAALHSLIPKKTKSVPEQNADVVPSEEHAALIASGMKPPDLADSSNQLKFDSNHHLFLKLTKFYYEDEEITSNSSVVAKKTKITPRNVMLDLSTMDSDDDEPEEGVDDDDDEKMESQFEAYDLSEDTPISDAVMSLKTVNKKVPVYFSDILEILTEAPTSKDEAANDVLKRIAILKIPVLLFKNVRVDSPVAEAIARVLVEIDTGSVIEIPVVCGLFELAKLYPVEVFNLFGKISFDKDHYASGHRMVILSRFFEVTQLLSKQKCFCCFSEATGKLDKLLENIHPPFIREYMMTLRAARKCKTCFKIEGGHSKIAATRAGAKALPENTTSANASIAVKKPEMTLPLTWREIVDQRVEAKTRRFASKRQDYAFAEDMFSAKLAPIVWASIANRLTSQASVLLNPSHAEALSVALFTAQAFRVLGTVVLGTSGIYCPHYRNISLQSAELVNLYLDHPDPQVRRSVLSLLGVVIATAEGKALIVEAFESAGTFEKVKILSAKETDAEIKTLFRNVMDIVTASAFVQLGSMMIDNKGPDVKYHSTTVPDILRME